MLIVSDIHFGANEKRAVEDMLFAAKLLPPEERVAIIAGDLVQRATAEQYAEAAVLLHEIANAGLTLIVTPGNHDFQIPYLPLGTDKVNLLPEGMNVARERFKEVAVEAMLAQDGVFRKHDKEDEYDTITRVGDDVFVALRSSHFPQPLFNGTMWGTALIKQRQIDWARATLEREGLTGCRLHLLTHRSLWRSPGDKHFPMKRRRRLEEGLLKPLRFQTVIHGHNHVFRFERQTLPHTGVPIRRIAAPTLSTRAHGDAQDAGAFLIWSPAADPDRIARHTVGGPARRFDLAHALGELRRAAVAEDAIDLGAVLLADPPHPATILTALFQLLDEADEGAPADLRIDAQPRSELSKGLVAFSGWFARPHDPPEVQHAMQHFRDAVRKEKRRRLAFAHLGIATCRALTDDRAGTEKALENVLEVDPHKDIVLLRLQRGLAEQLGITVRFDAESMKYCRVCSKRVNGGLKWRLTHRFACRCCGHRTHVRCAADVKRKTCRACRGE